MAWTQADIDTLKSAIATGILQVGYADRTITYKSTDSQLKALAQMQREVNGSTDGSTYRLAATSKGV